jgi:hypothetical protein
MDWKSADQRAAELQSEARAIVPRAWVDVLGPRRETGEPIYRVCVSEGAERLPYKGIEFLEGQLQTALEVLTSS